jgi:hypothetical protein
VRSKNAKELETQPAEVDLQRGRSASLDLFRNVSGGKYGRKRNLNKPFVVASEPV